ncbi:glucuronyl hydrolase [Jejubacter calystegiae]|uniref:Glucuronyl hydrolase n=1 Tax=Jejubacter calystegiae TaxID=2579935 RepID=A0A4P8YLX3_9ENTR|nr:glycoside hydrolase family 88 protein [Jejubacter calystegiae]QCT21193.1 glucuronyl hydrolase [Jejubacter calystegiae]
MYIYDENSRQALDEQIIDELITRACAKLKYQLRSFANQYPAACSVDGQYPLTPNTDWTTGFWSGITGLAWKLSGDSFYASQLAQQVDSFRSRLAIRHELDTHDLGFLYSLSCVNAWRFMGNQDARKAALGAADLLIARYLPTAGIIQAWGNLDDPEQRGRMIIDCLMNLPLLYWATKETGDAGYAACARSHARQAMNYLMRSDYSTYHTFYMDAGTGAPLRGGTHQGFADDSCWARGQAWAIYGFALSYRETGDSRFLQAAINAARYFLCHLPEDQICYWDLSLTAPDTPKDSSAAVIAVCGLLELVNFLSILDPQREQFIRQALNITTELIHHYFDGRSDASGYLKHAVYNLNKERGVDEYSIWGDYFFFELLSRLKNPLNRYW